MVQEQKLLAGVSKTERTKIYALEELLTQVRQTIEDVAKETELVRELASVEDTCGNIRKLPRSPHKKGAKAYGMRE